MTKPRLPHLLLFTAVLSFGRPSLASDKTIDYCKLIATEALQDPTLIASNIVNNITDNPSCLFQVSLSNPSANAAIAPMRTSLWDALQTFNGGQQQGSSLPSSGSTNAISKPAGPTALVEEFGGANVTRGTSSSTVQWSPGTVFTNLALTGVNHLCLTKDKPKGCISAALLRNLAPLTFKITANTSNGSPSVAGIAMTPNSTASAQPVAVTSKGSSGPSLAGFTAQYSFFGSHNRAGVKSLTSKGNAPSSTEYFKNELKNAWQTSNALDSCDAYVSWKEPALQALQSKTTVAELQKEIEDQYDKLLTAMLGSQACQSALQHFGGFYAAILEARTYELFGAVQSSSPKPELALEYDLNTPQNQPSYSSIKATGNWQFGRSTPQSSSNTSSKPNKKQIAQQEDIRAYAEDQAAVLASMNTATSADTRKRISAKAKTLAQNNAQPWSFTLTATTDVYNSEPPSSVPSASHLRDIQAGTEISYLFSPSKNSGALRSFIGSVTAAAAYSYEDQTSPAILTGPALSDFTGLPGSTTAAFAQRGVIHLGQLRLGFGTGNNLNFPIAFTYSNRSELIVHPTWGLQFGISYNLTSLFTSSGATKPGGSSGAQ